jgi:hypothetical protein
MTIMASASRAVQEPAALAIPVTGLRSGWAFTERIPAKQRLGGATRESESERITTESLGNETLMR